MDSKELREFHVALGGSWTSVGGVEVVGRYGDGRGEHHALTATAGLIDLSARSRLVLLGADRQKMLNGQVTNNVKDLRPGQGCYAALVNAKAKMLSDLNIYALPGELLLDFEPGMASSVAARLEQFIVGDDVQIVDASPHYGLLSIQGPKATRVIEELRLFPSCPEAGFDSVTVTDPALGELYLMNHARTGSRGFDCFASKAALAALAEKLLTAARQFGGRACGWEALEVARIEAGIPRYGADMDETNLPPEAGIDARAISYSKGCYTGQEVIARIRTYGQVAKALRGMRLDGDLTGLPARGTKLFKAGQVQGFLTSATWSPSLQSNVALGYVRRESNQPATELAVGSADGKLKAVIVPLPFVGPQFAGE